MSCDSLRQEDNTTMPRIVLRSLTATVARVVAATVAVTPTACEPVAPPTTNAVAQPAQPAQPYCGGNSGKKRWDTDCVSRCIPDEQVFVTCTEKMGRVFNTRQGLLTAQTYGWTWETATSSAQRCSDYTARIWKLTLIWPQPTATTAASLFGRVTTTETLGECGGRVMTSMPMATDRLWYTGVEVVFDANADLQGGL